jgi:hypothetical protein
LKFFQDNRGQLFIGQRSDHNNPGQYARNRITLEEDGVVNLGRRSINYVLEGNTLTITGGHDGRFGGAGVFVHNGVYFRFDPDGPTVTEAQALEESGGTVINVLGAVGRMGRLGAAIEETALQAEAEEQAKVAATAAEAAEAARIAEMEAEVRRTVLSVPPRATATATEGPRRITITWNAIEGATNGYRVELLNAAGEVQQHWTTAENITTYTVERIRRDGGNLTLEPSTTYRFRVIASATLREGNRILGRVNGEPSSVVSATTGITAGEKAEAEKRAAAAALNTTVAPLLGTWTSPEGNTITIEHGGHSAPIARWQASGARQHVTSNIESATGNRITASGNVSFDYTISGNTLTIRNFTQTLLGRNAAAAMSGTYTRQR